MKIIAFCLLFHILVPLTYAQQPKDKNTAELHALIDKYARSRETGDTVLLKSILTSDIDQLVSSGEWRYGLAGAMKGMMQSSASNPGTRKFIIENVRFLNADNAIVDSRYEIENPDGTARKMWSTFIAVRKKGSWKITAIRNMLPAGRS